MRHFESSPKRSGRRLSRRGSVLVVALLASAGCSKSPRAILPSVTPADAAAKALAAYDGNNDGKIAADELSACPSLYAAIARIDTNRDGAIDKAEVEQRFAQYDTMADVVAFDLQIFAGGKPLDGATVTFTPEVFMGEGQQSYAGTTKLGVCNLEGQTVPLPGVPTGLYKVHIVHQPTNVDVNLGCEVASDAPDASRMAFDVNAKSGPPARRGG